MTYISNSTGEQIDQAVVKTKNGSRVVLLGSSITQGSVGISYNYWQIYGDSIPTLWVRNAGLQLVRNSGVGGNRSGQMLDRFHTDVTPYYPDIVIIEPIINDLAHFTDDTLASYNHVDTSDTRHPFDNTVNMVKQCFGIGAVPVIMIHPPNNARPVRAERARWYLYDIARYYGLQVIDPYPYLVNITNGQYASGYSDDGTHPNAAGVSAASPAGGSILTNLNAPTPKYFGVINKSAYGDMANILRNGNFALGTFPSSVTGWITNTSNANVTGVAATLPRTGKVFSHEATASELAYALYSGDFTMTTGHLYEFSGVISSAGLTPSTATGFSLTMALSGSLRFAPFRKWKHNGTYEFSEQFTVDVGGIFECLWSIQDIGTYTAQNFTLVDLTAMRAIYNPGWPTVPAT